MSKVKNLDGYKEVPSLGGDFFVNCEGVVINKDLTKLKPIPSLRGFKVGVKQARRVKKLWVRDLVTEVFGDSFDAEKIVELLEEVDWIMPCRLMYRVHKHSIVVRVLYQGAGPIERDEFYLSSLLDAKMILRRDGVYHSKWTPSNLAALLQAKQRRQAKKKEH